MIACVLGRGDSIHLAIIRLKYERDFLNYIKWGMNKKIEAYIIKNIFKEGDCCMYLLKLMFYVFMWIQVDGLFIRWINT